MVCECNQSQHAFSNKSSTESQPSRKLFRAVVQLDAHDQEGIKNESTVTTHNPLPGISSIVSKDNQNDKLQSDPSRDSHAIENVVKPILPRSEKPPFSSCSNVRTDGIEAVEILPVLMVLELGDDQDVYVPLQESIEEPEPSSPQTVAVAMEPEVSEMIVPSQRDGSAVHESRPATSDGPQQPVLREYNSQNFGKETFTRDFQPKWFKQYPWLNYSLDRKVGTCYACSTLLYFPIGRNLSVLQNTIKVRCMDAWIHGPKFFWHNEDWWPSQNVCEPPRETNPEVKFIAWSGFASQVDDRFLDPKKTSSWPHLVRVTTWVLRFVAKCRDEEKCLELTSTSLAVKELSNAEFWFKRSQAQAYSDDLTRLISGKELHRSSDIISLNPFVDNKGILRVRG